MSQQNPIHRDGGRRDEGEQPYRDHKETFAEKEAEIDRKAPLPEDADGSLTEDERNAAQADAAAKRFDEVGKKNDR